MTSLEIICGVTFKQGNMGIYYSVYQGDTLANDYLVKEVNEFLSQ